MKRITGIALALSLCVLPLTVSNKAYSQYEYNVDSNYAKYYEKGVEYYNSSEFTKAIEQFTQALKLAPANPAIRNNLAVSYISRGTYYHNSVKNYEEAADNYREALFYFKYDAPKDAPESPNADENQQIAMKNLSSALENTGINFKNPSYHYKKAKELRTRGKFRPAIVEYYLALDNGPANADAYEAIGDMYRVLQNEYRAQTAYEKALSINNSSPELYVKAGLAYQKNNKVDKAIKAYDQATALDSKNMDALNALEKLWEEQIKLNPRNAAAHANLGTVLQKKGDFEGALAQYNTAELIDPNNITVRLNLGTLYQAKGDLNTAIKAYDTILTVDPNNILSRYYKATALKQTKNYDAATAELKKILQIDPGNALAKKELVEIAKISGSGSENLLSLLKENADSELNNAKAQYDYAFEAHAKGNLSSAIEYYRKAINLDPRMADAYLNLGAALIAQNSYSQAIEALTKATELNPTSSKAQELLAEANKADKSGKYEEALKFHQEGKVREAISLYEEALEANPDNPEILINMGAAYQTDQQYDKALQKYEEALALDPNSPIIYYYMGTTYHAQGNNNLAVQNYEKAIEKEPDNQQYQEALKNLQESEVDDLLSKALDAYNTKAFDKATEYLNQALKLDESNAQAYYYMGIVMEARKDSNAAIRSYQRATQLDPDMDTAYYALGIALDKANDKTGAKAAFQKYVQLSGNKDDAFVKYAKDRLKQL
jgi:tetratricopeptide (TPR) repeat protein